MIAQHEKKEKKQISMQAYWAENIKLLYKCKECKKTTLKPIPAYKLIKNFRSVYKFCNDDLDNFVLLLRKGVYPYEYMDSWEKLDKTSILPKEAYYNKLNKKNISNIDYARVEKVWEVFKLKNTCENHDLYVQCDTLLLADVFENFRDKCIEIYGLDPDNFLSAPGLTWQVCLKKQE